MSAPLHTTIPPEAKNRAERILLGAMLREAHALPSVLSSLNTIALGHAQHPYSAVFTEILEQFKTRGTYTATTVSEKTGVPLLDIVTSDVDVDLPWAVDNWWTEYSKWAQLTAYNAATQNSGQHKTSTAYGLAEMRANVVRIEEFLGLNWTAGKTNAAEEFAGWLLEKAQGREKIPKTRPPQLALRKLIPYFEGGDVWTIAGDTSMGKTAYAVNLMSYFIDQGENGIYFSLEMPCIAIYKRLLGVRHGINPKKDWQGIQRENLQAGGEVANLPVRVIGDAFHIMQIEAAILSEFYQNGVSWVIIDLLDYVETDDKEDLKRIATIYRMAVRIGKQTGCVIFILAHLNRENQKRGGSKRPQLSDLKGSSTIGQASAGVLFIYRGEYYGIKEDEKGRSLVGVAEAIVAKQRNGETGTALMSWNEIRGFRDLPDYQPTPEIQAPKDFSEPNKEDPPF